MPEFIRKANAPASSSLRQETRPSFFRKPGAGFFAPSASPFPIQAKPSLKTSSGEFEEAADATADKIMRKESHFPESDTMESESIQRLENDEPQQQKSEGGDPRGKKDPISQYVEDLQYYRDHKPGFGDDGGYDYDMSKYYTDKIVYSFSLTMTFRFISKDATDKWTKGEKDAISTANNITNAAMGLLIPGKLAIPAAILTVILNPQVFTTVFDIDPRPGDTLTMTENFSLHLSVLGNNYVKHSTNVKHIDSKNTILKLSSPNRSNIDIGTTDDEINFMRTLTKIKNQSVTYLIDGTTKGKH